MRGQSRIRMLSQAAERGLTQDALDSQCMMIFEFRDGGKILAVWNCSAVAKFSKGSYMTATFIDGTKIAEDIKREVARQVGELAKREVQPGLAVVLVGDDAA